jgi:hypothetical protein
VYTTAAHLHVFRRTTTHNPFRKNIFMYTYFNMKMSFWCNGFLDFFHRLKKKITTIKITTFRKLVLLPSSGEKRGKRGTPTLLCPLRRISQPQSLDLWLRLALSKGPNRVGVPPFPLFSPEEGSRTSFRNVVILIAVILFVGRWKKSKNPLLHNIVHCYQNLLEFIKKITFYSLSVFMCLSLPQENFFLRRL